ncbi:stage II sporulation protein B [Bacillus sp. JCM 19046]|nr:stage II sporulation protein B [Bacillus sp. JCM 19045]GAF16063.1 stage II sporulation protein B [Bacillus sp. JCM 19046]
MKESKHTMSFTFPKTDNKPKPAPKPKQEEKIEIQTWDKEPFHAGKEERINDNSADQFIPKPDKLIDFTKKFGQKKSGREPFWDDGNRSLSPKLPPHGRKNKFRIQALPWAVVAAVFSAIVVGLGLGVVMYQMIIQDHATQGLSAEPAIPATAAMQDTVAFPTIHMDVIQGAAFSEKEKGEQVVLETQQQGLPAVLTTGEETQYMFMGIANDQSKAQALGQLINDRGQEVYVKTYTVDGGETSIEGESAANWFSSAHATLVHLSEITSAQLINEGTTTLNQEQMETVTTSLDQLKEARDRAFSQIGDTAMPFALSMSDELHLAGQKLVEYNQNKDATYLWESQQALLQALVMYEQTVYAIRK